jgi:hypothetical protein
MRKNFPSIILSLVLLAGCQSPYIYNPPAPIILSAVSKIAFERYKSHNSPVHFAVTADGKYSFQTHCESGFCQGDPWFAIEKCEARYGKKCYIYAELGKTVRKLETKNTELVDQYVAYTLNRFAATEFITGQIHNPGEIGEFYTANSSNSCNGKYSFKNGFEVSLDCKQEKNGGIPNGLYKGRLSSFSWNYGGNIDLKSRGSNRIEMKLFPLKGSLSSKTISHSNNIKDVKNNGGKRNTDPDYQVGLRNKTYKPVHVPKSISPNVNIIQVEDLKENIKIIVAYDTSHSNFNSKGFSWSQKLTKRYFCRHHRDILRSKDLIIHWKNHYNDLMSTIQVTQKTCTDEGVIKLSADQISHNSMNETDSKPISLLINWEGLSKPVRGTIGYKGIGDGPISIQVDNGWVNCSGKWKYANGSYSDSEGVNGVWAVACSNGTTVSGEYTSSKIGNGKGIGFDNKGKKVTIRYGKF